MLRKLASDPELRGQIVRYAISGGGLTLFYSAVYWVAAVPFQVAALVANTMAFLLTVAVGFAVHSRWSFRGHGRRDRPLRAYAIFLLINLAGFALNSFWVWLMVNRAGLSPSWPLLPIIFVTPWLSFYMNRRWTFAD